MGTETGIKDVYRGVQGACPRRAVTHAGGTAERSERRAVGMGLKLVLTWRAKGREMLEHSHIAFKFWSFWEALTGHLKFNNKFQMSDFIQAEYNSQSSRKQLLRKTIMTNILALSNLYAGAKAAW